MKKILAALGAITLTITPTLTVTSCFSIGDRAIEYLSSKITGDYEQTNKESIIYFEKEEIYDYSPVLSDYLKLMGSDKFDTNKYRALQMQFTSEMEFFEYQNVALDAKPDSKYLIEEPTQKEVFKKTYTRKDETEDSFDLPILLRIDNYTQEPAQKGDDIYFKDVVVREYRFEVSDQDKGIYVKTEKTKNVDIYIRNNEIDKLKEHRKVID